MKNTLICLHTHKSSGKTQSIREVYNLLTGTDVKVSQEDKVEEVTYNNVKTGILIESNGTPSQYEEKIKSLIDKGCNIIVCASQSSKKSIGIYKLADKHNYNVIWVSAIYDEDNNPDFNSIFTSANAMSIKGVIDKLILS